MQLSKPLKNFEFYLKLKKITNDSGFTEVFTGGFDHIRQSRNWDADVGVHGAGPGPSVPRRPV
jgi:hypothetical protein